MKLNAAQVQQTLNQMDARVLPDDHPIAGKLNEMFGEHTFFLDESGLKIVEPAEAAEETESGEIVSLADWNDTTFNSLRPHEPTSTGVVVVLNHPRH